MVEERASRNHDLLAWDRDHLWHPYSSATSPSLVHEVVSAEGVRLRLRRDGREVEVVDAMSSWWCAIHGYAVPELDAAVRDQVGRMSHVMFGGLTHEPAVELGRRLVELSGLPHVFLADSGFGVGRGGDEDGVAGAGGHRQDAASSRSAAGTTATRSRR